MIEGSLYLMMLFHDNATLIMMMMSREEEGLVGPWVAVGGSYPGSLAGWLRLHFPVLMMINDIFGTEFEVMEESSAGLYHDSIDALFHSRDLPIGFNILDF